MAAEISGGDLDSEVKQLLGGAVNSVTSVTHKPMGGTQFQYSPQLGKSICLVVAAVVFNDKDQLLMTQEGFHPHMGQWYLPAGRVDPNETLVEAARREVREETGLEFEPTSLIAVEAPAFNWFRFTFTGNITGGRLRTLDERDDETMQGGWWDVEDVLSAKRDGNPFKSFVLRGRDVIKLIQHGQAFHANKNPNVHPCILPVVRKHRHILVRPFVLWQHEGKVQVLVSKIDEQTTLPVIETDTEFPSVMGRVHQFLMDIHGDKIKVNIVECGLLAVEHAGMHKMYDGLCLSLKVVVELSNPEVVVSKDCVWHTVKNLALAEQCMSQRTVPFLYHH